MSSSCWKSACPATRCHGFAGATFGELNEPVDNYRPSHGISASGCRSTSHRPLTSPAPKSTSARPTPRRRADLRRLLKCDKLSYLVSAGRGMRFFFLGIIFVAFMGLVFVCLMSLQI
jgi:hypothetical protein